MCRLFVIIFCIIHVCHSEYNSLPDTLHHINRLEQQVTDTISTINNRYSQLTKNLEQFIQETSSKSFTPSTIENIQSQILQTARNLDTAASQCQNTVKDTITSLTASSKEDVSVCVNEAVMKLTNNITHQAETLIAKVSSVQGDVTTRIANCVKTNLINEVGLGLCLLAQVEPIENEIRSVVQDVEQTIGMSENVAQDITFGLGHCVLNIQDVVDTASEAIVNSFKSCVSL